MVSRGFHGPAFAAGGPAGCAKRAAGGRAARHDRRHAGGRRARDADALADAVSEEFVGPEGMDRDQFRRTMAVVWLRDKNVGVQLGPLEVELTGDRARVEFTAGTTGGAGWLPDRGQLHRVKTAWRLEGGDWKLISASWEPRALTAQEHVGGTSGPMPFAKGIGT